MDPDVWFLAGYVLCDAPELLKNAQVISVKMLQAGEGDIDPLGSPSLPQKSHVLN